MVMLLQLQQIDLETTMLFEPLPSLRNSMTASRSAPNNLGPTLLIVLGACMTPLIIGIPIILIALSRVRTRDGHRTYANLMPKLASWMRE
jgi:hypothetical protein